MKRRKKKHPITPEHWPTPDLFDKYREALDTAVKLATTHNVKPIRGSTVVFCDASKAMRVSILCFYFSLAVGWL